MNLILVCINQLSSLQMVNLAIRDGLLKITIGQPAKHCGNLRVAPIELVLGLFWAAGVQIIPVTFTHEALKFAQTVEWHRLAQFTIMVNCRNGWQLIAPMWR